MREQIARNNALFAIFVNINGGIIIVST